MKRNWLSTTALCGAMMVSMATAPAMASPGGTINTPFIANSTGGTTNGIGPFLQLQEMMIINMVVGVHLFGLFMMQQLANSQTPGGMSGNFDGIAAGEESSSINDRLSVWTSANYSEAESDFAPTAFDSETTSGSVGVDYVVSDNVTVGAFLSYSETDTTSAFNGGSSDTQSITFGPYASFVIDDMFSMDASVGYTDSESDNTRTVGAAIGRGTQDGDTTFFSTNLNAMKWYDNVGLSGRLGFSYSNTDNDAYTDSLATTFAATDSQLGQLQLGGRASYYTENFMPYVGATYVYDFISEDVTTTTPPQPDNDHDEVQLEAGLSIFGAGPVSGGISANYTVLREDYEAWGVGGNIAFRF